MNIRPGMEQLLCDYIEGTLEPARRDEVEALLSSDAELRKSVSRAMQARDALKSVPREKAPPQVTEAILAYAARRSTGWRIARLAAALLLAASLGVVIWSILPRETAAPMAANVPVCVEEAATEATAIEPEVLTMAAPPAIDQPQVQAFAAVDLPGRPASIIIRTGNDPEARRRIEAQLLQVPRSNLTDGQLQDLQARLLAAAPASEVELVMPDTIAMKAQVAKDSPVADAASNIAPAEPPAVAMRARATGRTPAESTAREMRFDAAGESPRYHLTIIIDGEPLPPTDTADTLPATAP